MSDSKQLQGKHALVTGGSRGIGAAVATSLLQHGARVTILGRDEKRLQKTVQELSALGEIHGISADVVDAKAVAGAFKSAKTRFGAIQILVNNAGVGASAPFLKTDHAMWRRILDTNLDGTYHCTQSALPDMLEANWGRIVNVASIAGLIGGAYITAYCASKHAVIGMTRALAVELGPKNITVNAVCPGYTETDMMQLAVDNIATRTGRTAEEARAELAARNPQKRLVQPHEVANTVLWLCLPGSEAINGQSIAIAGGEVQN